MSGGSPITLVRDKIDSPQQAYRPPLIHTRQNFKWSRSLQNSRHRHTTHHKHTTLSLLNGYVNAHSTLWHSYPDDHRGQLIADVISYSDHITLNTDTQPECQTPHYNKHLQQTSPRCLYTIQINKFNGISTHSFRQFYISANQIFILHF